MKTTFKDMWVLIMNDKTLFMFFFALSIPPIMYAFIFMYLVYMCKAVTSVGLLEERRFKMQLKGPLLQALITNSILLIVATVFIFIAIFSTPTPATSEPPPNIINIIFGSFFWSIIIAVYSLWVVIPEEHEFTVCTVLYHAKTKRKLFFFLPLLYLFFEFLSRNYSIYFNNIYYPIATYYITAWVLRDILNKPPKRKQKVKIGVPCHDY